MSEIKKNEKIDRKAVTSNMMWRFADKWGTQLISLVISTIIARILNPEAFGIITMANAFINIFSVFADSGLSDSLIQKKDADDLDYSSALYANIALCLVVYFALFFTAPIIANFYGISDLTIYIRVSAISVIISSYKNIQHAYVAKNFLFKNYFFASIAGTVGAGIIGVIMAINGYGIWSLIISDIFDRLVDTIICAIMVNWKPKLMFSFDRLKNLFSFGIKMLLVNVVQKIYDKLYQLVVGKVYTASDLAFYDKGDNVSNKLTSNVDSAINSVLFPTMSSVQNDLVELKKLTKRMLKINTYVIYPLLFGLFVTAEELVELIFTEKWLPAVPYIRIFCLIRLTLPVNTINANAIKSLGKSSLYLQQQTLIKVITIIGLFASLSFGVYNMALVLLLCNIIGMIIIAWPNGKLLNYSFDRQALDILPNIVICLIMSLTTYFVGSIIDTSIIITLLLKVLTGVATYLLLSVVFKVDSFVYLLDMLKKRK